MHYIIGTQIRAKTTTAAAQSSSKLRSVGAVQIKKTATSEHFVPGQTYTLYYIKKTDDDKMAYTFRDNSTEEKFDVIFESSKAADVYLSKVLGESLPDYDKFYDKNNR